MNPPEVIKAHKARLFEQWLLDPNTKKFFRALEKMRINHLTSASRNSTRTGVDNALEHNRLVEASAILKVIETYGPGSKYPYEELDRAEDSIAAVVG